MKHIKHIKHVAGLLLVAMGATAWAQVPEGQGTLDKVKSQGKVVIGTREASVPMAYALGAHEKFVGYHVELCEKIMKELAPQAKQEYFAMTPQNTMALVANGTVDIGCGPATNNLTRQQQVAFGLTTYISDVRMAVRADSGITKWQDLSGKTVSATTGTTAVQLLRKLEKDGVSVKTVTMKDNLESLLAVEQDRAAAFVLDDNLLAGAVSTHRDPKLFKIVGTPLQSEPIAILFRKNDPQFKQAVDGVLRRMMTSGEMEKHYNKWFMAPIPPRNVSLNLPLSDALRKQFANPNDAPIEHYNK
jgi:glutamate/aspartate transport system substrate-binding protein